MASTTILTNGRIFTPSTGSEGYEFQQTMIISGDRIQYVGSPNHDAIQKAKDSGAREIDLQDKIVVPSFIDSHMHIVDFSLSRRKLSLLSCNSLEEIRQAIKAFAKAHPKEPRIMCKSWVQSTTGGEALASMLDDLDPRPIYIHANDMHSGWCNTAALQELGVATMADPPGGTIHRDENGKPSGLLSEMAHLGIVPQFLVRATSLEDKLDALDDAAAAYTAAGYSGMIDMGMDDIEWDVLKAWRQRHGEKFPFHIAAHWVIPPNDDLNVVFGEVDRAIALHREYNPTTSPDFCIAGIKLMCDGVVDGCTAALADPYQGCENPVDPIWPVDLLQAVVKKADAAGLQIAIHAIGDKAVKNAIDALSLAQPGRRHRIEHLELTSPEDAKRLGQLGITASVQPVHSDPALFRAWPELIGKHRCSRAFAYREFLEGGAPVAFGTDSPTASHPALPNLYNATTRRSAIEPECTETVNSHFGLPLAAAVSAATTGAAYSRWADSWTGSLKAGLSADFVVLDMDWKAESLLKANVQQTWARGRKTFDASADGAQL
ncbi:amidohydrolase family protein [Aspergillus bombycis]|uniref:Amidohydrolase family protein n=1 Tax=Aspergillus bombycis TaxID=109264 RepID=A0A1F7ZZW2_9EURO|nr:amidohydrolase family protein [Aspergillus bombycis]OGM44991.1 amidohydrolase family protein [Aspergillus bombycis]